MTRRRASRRAGACVVALVTVLCMGGCARDGVSTDAGVSSTEITLGVMADQSGPFKNIGQGLVKGNELWAADVNGRGGVCGRQIKLEIGDTSYRPEVATSIYRAQQKRVLGYLHILGSPVNAGLAAFMKEDGVTGLAMAWSSFTLDNPYQIIPGTTYDLEVINGLSYLREQGLIKRGDTIGHIYLNTDYGDNALLGSSYYAQAHNLTLQPVKVLSTDANMTDIVTNYRRSGVKAIILTTSPAQTGSAVIANRTSGLNVPLLGNGPSFDPALMNGPAAAGLNRLWLATSSAPFSSNLPIAKEIARKFTTAFPQTPPTAGVPAGYADGLIWEHVLQRACDAKDMTKAGIRQAFRESNAVGTDDLKGTLDFSKRGSPATRSVYISKPDPAEQGGLKQLAPLYKAPEADSYKAPLQQG